MDHVADPMNAKKETRTIDELITQANKWEQLKKTCSDEKHKFKEYVDKVTSEVRHRADLHVKDLESQELSCEMKFTNYTNKIRACLASHTFEECHATASATWNAEPLQTDIHLNDRVTSFSQLLS
jgi:hypothetical protein